MSSSAARAEGRHVLLAALGCAFALQVHAQAGAPQRRSNAFNDPFFQISDRLPGCPAPVGPFVTEAERREQSHHRAERGTSCWLAGRCDKPNFYAYDADIARDLRAALADEPRFRHSTLWITVQGRVVYVEGCVPQGQVSRMGRDIEAFVRTIPNVQQAVASVYSDLKAKPPYRTLTPTTSSRP